GGGGAVDRLALPARDALGGDGAEGVLRAVVGGQPERAEATVARGVSRDAGEAVGLRPEAARLQAAGGGAERARREADRERPSGSRRRRRRLLRPDREVVEELPRDGRQDDPGGGAGAGEEEVAAGDFEL